MDLANKKDENNDFNIIEDLNLDYYQDQDKEKNNTDFNDKMSSLLMQLEAQIQNVRNYSNLNLPLENLDTKIQPIDNLNNQNQFNNNFGFNFNTNSNLIGLNDYNANLLGINNNNLIGMNNNNNLIGINYNTNLIGMNNNNNLTGTNNNNNDNNNNNNNLIEINTNPNNGNLIEIKDNDKANPNQIKNNTNSNANIIANNPKEEPNENEASKKEDIKEEIIINEYNFIVGKNNINNDNDKENNSESIVKDNTKENIKIDNIQEIQGSLIKNSQNIYYQLQEELKKKEENEELKKLEEFKKREEELKKREEELKRKEKEQEERERRLKEEEIKRKEAEGRKEEERRKEEDEEEQKDRYLKEEYDRLEKEEKEKKEEEERENERIKNERLMKEKKEREENERRKKEEEKKKELERKKREEELRQEKELAEQINKQKIEEDDVDELKIMEVDDDEIEEIQEEVSFAESPNSKSNIKQNITKTNIPNNDSNNSNSQNPKETKEDKLKSKVGNKNNKIPSTDNKKEKENDNKNTNAKNKPIKEKANNIKKSQNSNLKDSKLKQSQVKKSTISNNSSRKPKQKKEPEKDIQDFTEIHASVQAFKKSEIFKKLEEEERDKIIDYINNVEEFNTNNPDLEGINSFPYINQLDKDEKALNDIIPYFEDKIIGNYNEKLLDKKVNDILSGKNFVSKEEEIKLVSEILEIPNDSHMDIIKEEYEKEKFKNLPKIKKKESLDPEQIEEKLFDKEEFFPEFNSPFSKLENLQTFIYKYSVHENPNLMAKALKNFNNWRMTLGDGNSFYRVIMFAIIEHCIFERNVELLGMILNEMSSDAFLKVYKLKKIKYEKPFEILSIILLMIENNMEEKAYELFLKAYNLKDKKFDLLLILYLKKVLYNFAKEFNKLLDDKKKGDGDKKLIENVKINLDEIDSLYIEPNFYIFNFVSYLFDININLFLISGDFINPKTDIKKIMRKSDDKAFPTFIFGYFFSSYHILYSPDIDNNVFKNTLENDNPKITQLLFVLESKKKCDICFQETKHLVFLRKKFIMCQPCLYNYIMYNILKERKIKFAENKCFGKEFYCRPIHLQDEFYMDDYEFIELVDQKNFSSEICSIDKCKKCDKIKNGKDPDSEFLELKCGCIYCAECIENTIKELTKGLGYLLECEIPKHNNIFVCSCKARYTYNDIKEFIEADDDQIEEAKKRMSEYIKKDCMICMKDLLKEEKVKKIKMRKNTFIPEHFMCKMCYNKCFKEAKIEDTEEDGEEEKEDETKDMAKENQSEDNKPKKNEKLVKLDEQKVYCTICSDWHSYKDEGDGCGCLVY